MTFCYAIFGIPRTIDEVAGKAKRADKQVSLGMYKSYRTFESFYGRFAPSVIWQIWEHQPFAEINGRKYKIGKPTLFEYGGINCSLEWVAKGIETSKKEAELKLDKMKQKLQNLGTIVAENYAVYKK